MKIKWRKDSLFSKWCWESWTGTCNNEVRISSHYIQKNSRCFKDLHIDMLLETPRREYRQNILWNKLYECFLGSVSQGKRNKAKINKWDLIKFISFCTTKETINKVQRENLWTGRKYLQTMQTTRTLLQNIKTANVTQPHRNKQPNPKNGQKI